MKFEDAFDKAVKAYYEGRGFESMEKAGQKLVYSKEYFDKIGKPSKSTKKVGTAGAKVDANTSSINKKKEHIDGSV